jgi:hypothetical protein
MFSKFYSSDLPYSQNLAKPSFEDHHLPTLQTNAGVCTTETFSQLLTLLATTTTTTSNNMILKEILELKVRRRWKSNSNPSSLN